MWWQELVTSGLCRLIAFIKARPGLKSGLMDTNVDGDTPLHVAIQNGHKEAAYCLIKAPDKMKYLHNNEGKDAVQLAYEAGYSELCQLMNSPGQFENCSIVADVEMSAVKKYLIGVINPVAVHWMELYMAIQKNDEDVLSAGLMRVKDGKRLLWHQYHLGKALLHEAVTVSGDGPLMQLVQFMISNGLTDAALLGDKSGDTALHWAIYKTQLSKAVCLIKAAPRAVYQVNNKGESPLYLAVKSNYQDFMLNMFQMLSRSCLPACATGILLHPKNATLAHVAIKSRNPGALQTITEHLPELVHMTDEKGWRPLSYTAYKGYLEEFNYLLTNFPKSAEKYDMDGSLPIHKAVGGGHVSIIQAFLSHCPEALHHVDRKGRSVLHIAVRYARADILDYLTKNIKMDDSFLNLKDNEGKTFMDYAKDLKPN